MLPAIGSYAMAPPANGSGERGVSCCVQSVPSYVQVSPRYVLFASVPPYSTINLFSRSYAIAAHRRGDVLFCGVIWCHVKPFHSQVSLNVLASSHPPNISMRWRVLSYAIA